MINNIYISGWYLSFEIVHLLIICNFFSINVKVEWHARSRRKNCDFCKLPGDLQMVSLDSFAPLLLRGLPQPPLFDACHGPASFSLVGVCPGSACVGPGTIMGKVHLKLWGESQDFDGVGCGPGLGWRVGYGYTHLHSRTRTSSK